ncbi:GD18477 [Drosophila simulans]|uniref:GD18477 n=1 Tax=Drosophila simulans TaxID=7240 RepID=B4QZX6_DROSI|nr:GD18477 [Drosophila simulans]
MSCQNVALPFKPLLYLKPYMTELRISEYAVEVHIAADDFIILRLFLAISMQYSSESTLHSTPLQTRLLSSNPWKMWRKFTMPVTQLTHARHQNIYQMCGTTWNANGSDRIGGGLPALPRTRSHRQTSRQTESTTKQ